MSIQPEQSVVPWHGALLCGPGWAFKVGAPGPAAAATAPSAAWRRRSVPLVRGGGGAPQSCPSIGAVAGECLGGLWSTGACGRALSTEPCRELGWPAKACSELDHGSWHREQQSPNPIGSIIWRALLDSPPAAPSRAVLQPFQSAIRPAPSPRSQTPKSARKGRAAAPQLYPLTSLATGGGGTSSPGGNPAATPVASARGVALWRCRPSSLGPCSSPWSKQRSPGTTACCW